MACGEFPHPRDGNGELPLERPISGSPRTGGLRRLGCPPRAAVPGAKAPLKTPHMWAGAAVRFRTEDHAFKSGQHAGQEAACAVVVSSEHTAVAVGAMSSCKGRLARRCRRCMMTTTWSSPPDSVGPTRCK